MGTVLIYEDAIWDVLVGIVSDVPCPSSPCSVRIELGTDELISTI